MPSHTPSERNRDNFGTKFAGPAPGKAVPPKTASPVKMDLKGASDRKKRFGKMRQPLRF